MDALTRTSQLRSLTCSNKSAVAKYLMPWAGGFEKRALAVLSGGNDLIAKPIWPQELALKMVMRLVESSEPPADKTPAPAAAHPAAAATSHQEAE